ncbi:hypothetical protein JNJ66_04935 [Candidatus Saccharibacteria bacterium]|nr:hypothetical protein [Candidatus Saccharibacteria bacterium]
MTNPFSALLSQPWLVMAGEVVVVVLVIVAVVALSLALTVAALYVTMQLTSNRCQHCGVRTTNTGSAAYGDACREELACCDEHLVMHRLQSEPIMKCNNGCGEMDRLRIMDQVVANICCTCGTTILRQGDVQRMHRLSQFWRRNGWRLLEQLARLSQPPAP